ncbi:MAG: tRNA preQ1(34) S-adenosylmethionine ribosyltransferase-isomerase QueA [Thermodesulfovibrio sp.]|nr:tRNA preQ1(34) S-adenosylmethionine ribosyltransferase-isomerase QueA [Thermodesulfovibrio sp.]
MKTAEYDFPLPEELIASRPVTARDSARLMVLRRDGRTEHRTFSELPELLIPGDMLVINNSRVFPARVRGTKPDGSSLDILLVSENSDKSWIIMTKGRYSGEVVIENTLSAAITHGKTAVFSRDIRDVIWKIGRMPLPPYIRRDADEQDRERYQTVYAEKEGSIAAPTAGLHFTPALLDRLKAAGILIRTVTLHVGIGTFRPVKAVRVEDHDMAEESFEINAGLIPEIHRVRNSGRRVIAVGTTSTRTLEGYASGNCTVFPSDGCITGTTDIFIREGHPLRLVDALITNFHLPCSTPLMLVSAFAGRERLLGAYEIAIAMGYRFFSYGDAMLFL